MTICNIHNEVHGFCTQPLDPIMIPGSSGWERFNGRLGMYLKDGRLSFFRQVQKPSDFVDPSPPPPEKWESTGFVVDLSWTSLNSQLTPCVSFRETGNYQVRITRFGYGDPPIAAPPDRMTEVEWTPMDWDAVNRRMLRIIH